MRKLLGWAEALLVFSISAGAFIGVLLLLRAFGKPLWSGEAAGWTQAVGAIVAIFAAFLVADRQFQMSRREAQIAQNDETFRRIRILQGVFRTLILEILHIESIFHYDDAKAVHVHNERILELRDTIRAIPVMDAPTSQLAVSIAAIPPAIDVAIASLIEVQAAERSGISIETQEPLRQQLRRNAQIVNHMSNLGIAEGDRRIEQLGGLRVPI